MLHPYLQGAGLKKGEDIEGKENLGTCRRGLKKEVSRRISFELTKGRKGGSQSIRWQTEGEDEGEKVGWDDTSNACGCALSTRG